MLTESMVEDKGFERAALLLHRHEIEEMSHMNRLSLMSVKQRIAHYRYYQRAAISV